MFFEKRKKARFAQITQSRKLSDGNGLIKIHLQIFECRFDFLDQTVAGRDAHFGKDDRQNFKKKRDGKIVAFRRKQKVLLQSFVFFDQVDDVFHRKFLQRIGIVVKVFQLLFECKVHGKVCDMRIFIVHFPTGRVCRPLRDIEDVSRTQADRRFFVKQRAGAVQHDGYRMEGAGRTVVIAAVIVVVNIFIHDQCSDINVI